MALRHTLYFTAASLALFIGSSAHADNTWCDQNGKNCQPPQGNDVSCDTPGGDQGGQGQGQGNGGGGQGSGKGGPPGGGQGQGGGQWGGLGGSGQGNSGGGGWTNSDGGWTKTCEPGGQFDPWTPSEGHWLVDGEQACGAFPLTSVDHEDFHHLRFHQSFDNFLHGASHHDEDCGSGWRRTYYDDVNNWFLGCLVYVEYPIDETIVFPDGEVEEVIEGGPYEGYWGGGVRFGWDSPYNSNRWYFDCSNVWDYDLIDYNQCSEYLEFSY